jgi:DNA-binding Lrp family transcriptional regulator
MINCAQNSRESQDYRLKIKTLSQQMLNLAVEGTGISPWEAQVLVKSIEQVYFSDPDLSQAADGQLKYSCIAINESAGKKVEECRMVTVILTLFDHEDNQQLHYNGKQASIVLRRRRLMRITEQAREQGGLLSQEDLAQILMCDVRTIRRDIKDLRQDGIVVATRGQVNDIGPGVSHRGIAVRGWLEGKEPVKIARDINHSLGAVENYLEKFKRVVYLRRKGFTDQQIAMTIGISIPAVKTFTQLYKEFKNKSFFKQRIAEIDLIGSQYYKAQDEKKDLSLSKNLSREGSSR